MFCGETGAVNGAAGKIVLSAITSSQKLTAGSMFPPTAVRYASGAMTSFMGARKLVERFTASRVSLSMGERATGALTGANGSRLLPRST